MAGDESCGMALPPPPLSEATEETGFGDVRLPWATPPYLAVAALVQGMPLAVAIHRAGHSGIAWHNSAVDCVLALLVGAALVAGDRLVLRWSRPTRWIAGLSVGVLVAFGGQMAWFVATTTRAMTLPPQRVMLLAIPVDAATWILVGASCAVAARLRAGVWWRLPAAGGAAAALLGGAGGVGYRILAPGQWGPLPHALVQAVGWPALDGALIGLALAAALAQAHRSARRARGNATDGTGPEEG